MCYYLTLRYFRLFQYSANIYYFFWRSKHFSLFFVLLESKDTFIMAVIKFVGFLKERFFVGIVNLFREMGEGAVKTMCSQMCKKLTAFLSLFGGAANGGVCVIFRTVYNRMRSWKCDRDIILCYR